MDSFIAPKTAMEIPGEAEWGITALSLVTCQY